MTIWPRTTIRPLGHFKCIITAASLLIGISAAEAAIAVNDAKIANGRLIVSGTSDVGDTVSLDGHYTTDVSNKTFIFNLVYVPASCIVSLGAPGTTTPNTRAVIANCAPMPFNPMGEWQSEARYQPNDLVERKGGTYAALANARPNQNEDPLTATSFWRNLPTQTALADRTLIIGPKGERGDSGQNGAKGERGEDGALASLTLHTIKADITRPAIENGQDKGDWKIASTGSLAVNIAKGERNDEAELTVSGSTLPDIDHCTTTATFFGADAGNAYLGPLKMHGETASLTLHVGGDLTHLEAMVLCPKAK